MTPARKGGSSAPAQASQRSRRNPHSLSSPSAATSAPELTHDCCCPPPLATLPQARTPAAQALMKELTEAHSFYTTPAGSNDDW
jgi:hypothetical protein